MNSGRPTLIKSTQTIFFKSNHNIIKKRKMWDPTQKIYKRYTKLERENKSRKLRKQSKLRSKVVCLVDVGVGDRC
jgi:hypothetical protein